MEKHLDLLMSVELFQDIDRQDLLALLRCLGAHVKRYDRGSVIYQSGAGITNFGVVLTGQVQVYQDDYYGNRSIFTNVSPGNLFGESFACAQSPSLPISVAATLESDLLFIDCRRLSLPCAKACAFHSRVIRNMLHIIARNNIALTQKIEFTSRRTTREKLLAYLSAQAQEAGSNAFTIPFDRRELADYLCVDRSGLSAELGRLRGAGVLRFHKNRFELL